MESLPPINKVLLLVLQEEKQRELSFKAAFGALELPIIFVSLYPNLILTSLFMTLMLLCRIRLEFQFSEMVLSP